MVLFLLYFLLEFLSLISSVFLKAIMTTSALPVGINSRVEKEKSVWNAELAAPLEAEGVFFCGIGPT